MITFLVGLVVGAAGGFVGSYFLFRNNNKIKDKTDAVVDVIKK